MKSEELSRELIKLVALAQREGLTGAYEWLQSFVTYEGPPWEPTQAMLDDHPNADFFTVDRDGAVWWFEDEPLISERFELWSSSSGRSGIIGRIEMEDKPKGWWRTAFWKRERQ